MGSPPLSYDEAAEPADQVMRRALMTDHRRRDESSDNLEGKSPEVGSAISAKEAFGTSSSNSMNGKHHH